MSIYCVSIGDHEYHVNLNGDQAQVDGKPVKLNLVRLNGAGLHLLRREKKVVDVHLYSQGAEMLEFLVGGRRIVARVENARRRIVRGHENGHAGMLDAPMAGLIVEVCIEPGERVQRGQTLVVLESMKMQMQLRAPSDGIASAVQAVPGRQVEKGAALVQIDLRG